MSTFIFDPETLFFKEYPGGPLWKVWKRNDEIKLTFNENHCYGGYGKVCGV